MKNLFFGMLILSNSAMAGLPNMPIHPINPIDPIIERGRPVPGGIAGSSMIVSCIDKADPELLVSYTSSSFGGHPTMNVTIGEENYHGMLKRPLPIRPLGVPGSPVLEGEPSVPAGVPGSPVLPGLPPINDDEVINMNSIQTPLGQMVSLIVMRKFVADAPAIVFSLIVPTLHLGQSDEHEFETVYHRGFTGGFRALPVAVENITETRQLSCTATGVNF